MPYSIRAFLLWNSIWCSFSHFLHTLYKEDHRWSMSISQDLHGNSHGCNQAGRCPCQSQRKGTVCRSQCNTGCLSRGIDRKFCHSLCRHSQDCRYEIRHRGKMCHRNRTRLTFLGGFLRKSISRRKSRLSSSLCSACGLTRDRFGKGSHT